MKKQTFLMNFILSFFVGLAVFLIMSYNANDEVIADERDVSNTEFTAEIIDQLKAAQTVAGKYRAIEQRLADDCVDINVIQQSMGSPLLKAELSDTVFNPATPQILVYNK